MQRIHTNEWPFGSGVWGKKEWVCPRSTMTNIVSMYEGHTNLFWAERLGQQIGVPDLWVKLCGNSHTGSFKDLGMTVLVSVCQADDGRARRSERWPAPPPATPRPRWRPMPLQRGSRGHRVPAADKVSTAQLIQPIANGAMVLSLDTDFDGCMAIVKEVTRDNSIYLANSMNSLRIEGQKTVGIEIVQQFDWEVPDWIIIPVGNLGNISALGKGLLLMRDLGLIDKLPRLVAAQAERANPFYLSYQTGFESMVPVTAQKTLASAIQIGNPVSYEKAIKVMRAVRRHRRAGHRGRAGRTPPPVPISRACTPALTPAWPWRCCSSWWSAARSAARTGWSSCRRPTGSSSPTSRSATTRAPSRGWRRCAATRPSSCRPMPPSSRGHRTGTRQEDREHREEAYTAYLCGERFDPWPIHCP
jgi:threonine synthase